MVIAHSLMFFKFIKNLSNKYLLLLLEDIPLSNADKLLTAR